MPLNENPNPHENFLGTPLAKCVSLRRYGFVVKVIEKQRREVKNSLVWK